MSTIHQGTVEERVRQCVRVQLSMAGTKIDDFPNDAHLIVDLKFDSLDLVEFTMAVEDEFDIEVDDDQMAALTTVQQVIDLVTSKV